MARRPDVEVVPSEAPNDDALAELVRDGEIDFAVIDLPPRDGPFDTLPIFRASWALVMRRDSRFAAIERPVDMGSLSRLPLIAAGGPDAERVGLPVRCVGAETALAFARAGVAPVLALAPDAAWEDPVLEVLDLRGVLPQRVVGLCWHRERELGQALNDFRAAAEAVLGSAASFDVIDN
jgi:DNA-binding transcriptional LysR family regulator